MLSISPPASTMLFIKPGIGGGKGGALGVIIYAAGIGVHGYAVPCAIASAAAGHSITGSPIFIALR